MKIVNNVCHIEDIEFGGVIEYNGSLWIKVRPDPDVFPKVKKGTAVLVHLEFGIPRLISEEGTVKRSRARLVE